MPTTVPQQPNAGVPLNDERRKALPDAPQAEARLGRLRPPIETRARKSLLARLVKAICRPTRPSPSTAIFPRDWPAPKSSGRARACPSRRTTRITTPAIPSREVSSKYPRSLLLLTPRIQN